MSVVCIVNSQAHCHGIHGGVVSFMKTDTGFHMRFGPLEHFQRQSGQAVHTSGSLR